jgi:hypothetical protein
MLNHNTFGIQYRNSYYVLFSSIFNSKSSLLFFKKLQYNIYKLLIKYLINKYKYYLKKGRAKEGKVLYMFYMMCFINLNNIINSFLNSLFKKYYFIYVKYNFFRFLNKKNIYLYYDRFFYAKLLSNFLDL